MLDSAILTIFFLLSPFKKVIFADLFIYDGDGRRDSEPEHHSFTCAARDRTWDIMTEGPMLSSPCHLLNFLLLILSLFPALWE